MTGDVTFESCDKRLVSRQMIPYDRRLVIGLAFACI